MTRSSLVTHLALAAATVLAVLPTLGEGLMLYDLGEVVFFTDAFLDGRRPGLDYAVNAYGPGRYLLLAGLWEVLGRNLHVVWGLFLILRLGITALTWEVSRRFLRGPWVFGPVLALLLAPGPLHKGFYLLGTLVLARVLLGQVDRDGPREDARSWLVLGLAVAGVALFRLDLGAFGLLLALFLLLARRGSPRMLVPLLAPLAVGGAAAALLLLAAGEGALAAVVSQLLDDILKNQTIAYPRMPGLGELFRFESWDPVFLWVPVPIYLAMLGLLVRRWKRDAAGRIAPATLALAIVGLLGFLTCNQVRMKPEYGHLLQAGPMLWLCSYILLERAWQRGGLPLRALALLLGLLLPAGLVATSLTTHRGDIYTGGFTIPWDRTQPLETPLGEVDLNVEEHASLQPLLETLGAFPPGPIWVPTNQPLYYALSDRPDVSGYVGVVYYADSLPRQIEVIARLEAWRPRLAVFVDDSIEGPERGLARAAPQLYSYLMTNYAPLVTYGSNQLMERRGPVGPPAVPTPDP